MKKVFLRKIWWYLVLLSVVSTSNIHAQMTSKQFLEKYSTCQQVKAEDNKLGFTIERITKEENNSFLVEWKSSSEIIMKNHRNHVLIAMSLYFVDADDFTNFKEGLYSHFQGNIGDMNKMIVTLDRPAKSLIIYFKGIDGSVPNSTQFLTSRLFFMAELGVSPKLLEKTPRYAGDLFREFEDKEKK